LKRGEAYWWQGRIDDLGGGKGKKETDCSSVLKKGSVLKGGKDTRIPREKGSEEGGLKSIFLKGEGDSSLKKETK